MGDYQFSYTSNCDDRESLESALRGPTTRGMRDWVDRFAHLINKSEEYDPVHELLCDVMELSIRDFLYLYSRKGDDRTFYSALGHILNDDNWTNIGLDIHGEDIIKTIIRNNPDKIGKWTRAMPERIRNG